MKARVIRKQNGEYVGEVYGTWENIFGQKWEGWKQVTYHCLTKFGAKRELKKWKEHNANIEEFEL